MKEKILFVMLIGILLLGFLSSSLTGYAPRGDILSRDSKTAGAGYGSVGNRYYLITTGSRTDTLGGPGRPGYSIAFGNFPFEGKGDIDGDGEITRDDLYRLQTLYQRASGLGTPLQRTRSRWEYDPDKKIVDSSRTYGTYDEQGDINNDGQITYEDVKVLRNALNIYLGTKTSLMADYKAKANCVNLGSQTCAVGKRYQIGTCEELFPGADKYKLDAWVWTDCDKGFSCMVRGSGRAECVRDISRQMESKYS